MRKKELGKILELHAQWLHGKGGNRADLRGENLQYASLRGADLRHANLQYASLRGANLQYAKLQHADLQYANLRGADLQYANLQDAKLQYADLVDADLQYANLQDANLRNANLEGATLDYQIEEGLLQKVAKAALQDDCLDMAGWHTCDTTHCLGGWATHLVEKGKELEDKVGTQIAGLLLLGPEAHSHFFDSDDKAREYLEGVE